MLPLCQDFARDPIAKLVADGFNPLGFASVDEFVEVLVHDCDCELQGRTLLLIDVVLSFAGQGQEVTV